MCFYIYAFARMFSQAAFNVYLSVMAFPGIWTLVALLSWSNEHLYIHMCDSLLYFSLSRKTFNTLLITHLPFQRNVCTWQKLAQTLALGIAPESLFWQTKGDHEEPVNHRKVGSNRKSSWYNGLTWICFLAQQKIQLKSNSKARIKMFSVRAYGVQLHHQYFYF